jgi:hypothetical protein
MKLPTLLRKGRAIVERDHPVGRMRRKAADVTHREGFRRGIDRQVEMVARVDATAHDQRTCPASPNGVGGIAAPPQ